MGIRRAVGEIRLDAVLCDPAARWVAPREVPAPDLWALDGPLLALADRDRARGRGRDPHRFLHRSSVRMTCACAGMTSSTYQRIWPSTRIGSAIIRRASRRPSSPWEHFSRSVRFSLVYMLAVPPRGRGTLRGGMFGAATIGVAPTGGVVFWCSALNTIVVPAT